MGGNHDGTVDVGNSVHNWTKRYMQRASLIAPPWSLLESSYSLYPLACYRLHVLVYRRLWSVADIFANIFICVNGVTSDPNKHAQKGSEDPLIDASRNSLLKIELQILQFSTGKKVSRVLSILLLTSLLLFHSGVFTYSFMLNKIDSVSDSNIQ